MNKYDNFYKTDKDEKVPVDQLLQCLRIVWDGDLISKDDRDTLHQMAYIHRAEGFNIITPMGIRYLVDNNYIKA